MLHLLDGKVCVTSGAISPEKRVAKVVLKRGTTDLAATCTTNKKGERREQKAIEDSTAAWAQEALVLALKFREKICLVIDGFVILMLFVIYLM